MSSDEYWHGDPSAVRAYRAADEMRRERKSQELWLMGEYVYQAVLSASPVLNAFSKEHKPLPYMAHHIPVTKSGIDAAQERKMKEQAEWMQRMADMANRKRRERLKNQGGLGEIAGQCRERTNLRGALGTELQAICPHLDKKEVKENGRQQCADSGN